MKSPAQYKAEFAQNDERFFRIVHPTADELTVILKGHLLVEEQLRSITRSSVANPRYFDEAKLTFSNALCLARAVAGHFNEGACWVAAEQLNTVRNKIAHRAEPGPAAALLDRFYSVCEAESRWSAWSSAPRSTAKLSQYICCIWATFDALRAVVQVCSETTSVLHPRP
ncbi:hypothetical protein [Achromobacter aegrifaciens]|uniref:hypothetical protein n=1 Tax=Achromobacter aegrifaciens TaxID=1287736 RepID=UPI0012E30C14|nr:hypothetical protein [Achromobacter aegrifaciens]